MRVVLKGLPLVFMIFLTSLALVPAAVRWNWLRPSLSHWVGSQLGRELIILENLELGLSQQPWIRLRGVRLANAPWCQHALLAEIEELTVHLDLWALLREGRWVLPEVLLTHPVLHLERSLQGTPNWVFGEGKGGGSSHLTVGQLTIQEGQVTFIDPLSKTNFTAQVAASPILSNRALVLHGNGRIHEGQAEVELRTESLATLLEPGRPFGIEGSFSWGNTYGRWAGTLDAPLALHGIDLEVEIAGPSPAVLFPITGIPLPDLPPYHVQGHVSQQEKKWVIRHLQGVVGGSDFAGDVTLESREKRPRLTGYLKSNHLALIDIGIGRPSSVPEPEPEPEPVAVPSNNTVVGTVRTTPLGLDVDLEIQGRRVVTPTVLEEAKTRLRLEDGQLHLDPFHFGLAGGQVQSMLGLDTHYRPMPTTLEAHFQRLDLKRLLTPLGVTQQNSGILTGQLQFSSNGGSVTNLLATAEGSAFFVVTRGHLDSLLLALVRLDLAKTLSSLLFLDNRVELRCAVAQVRAHNGVLTISPLVIDTTSTKVTGSGTIDLHQEHLDLTVEPHPKDLSLFSAYSPLHVTGSFQSPEVRPKVGPLGGRMAAAAALAALVGPIGAVMPFIEPGIGEDNDCQDLVHNATAPFEDMNNKK